MAALVISISFNSSDESVGSVMPQVILYGTILIEVPVVPADLPVALEVRTAVVASHVWELDLESHSSSETGPSESPLPQVPVAPMVSPFMCSDDCESEPAAVLPESKGTYRFPLPAPSTFVTTATDIISPLYAPPRFNVEAETDVGVGIEIYEGIGMDVEPFREDFPDLVSDDGSLEVIQLGLDVAMQQLETDSMIASAERTGLSSCVAVLERSNTGLRETLRMESVRADRLFQAYDQKSTASHKFCLEVFGNCSLRK
nr:hypothetical protein [Tanacetum cinerariifolium]